MTHETNDKTELTIDAELESLWSNDLTRDQFNKVVRALGELGRLEPHSELKHRLKSIPEDMGEGRLGWLSPPAIASFVLAVVVVAVTVVPGLFREHALEPAYGPYAALNEVESIVNMWELSLDSGEIFDEDIRLMEELV